VAAKFGRKDDDKQEKVEQWRLDMRAELERLSALPLTELAAQVMIRGFGPGGPGADDDAITLGQANVGAGPTADRISFEFAHDRGFTFPLPTAEDFKLRERVAMLVAEGLQNWSTHRLCAFSCIRRWATWTGRQPGAGGQLSNVARSRASCSADPLWPEVPDSARWPACRH
jgi:hypothetical protein